MISFEEILVLRVRKRAVETFVGWGGNEGGVAVTAPRLEVGMCQVAAWLAAWWSWWWWREEDDYDDDQEEDDEDHDDDEDEEEGEDAESAK